MKYPVILRVFASITLLIGLILGLISIALLSPLNQLYIFRTALFLACFAGFAIWSIFVSSAWFFASRKSGFPFLVSNLLSIGTLTSIFLYFAIVDVSSGKTPFLILVFIFGVFFIFHFLGLFQESILILKRETAKFESILVGILFFILMILPMSVILYLHNFSYKAIPVNIERIDSSGDLGMYTSNNLVDNSFETWWTPANRNGLNSNFRIYL